MKTNMRLDIRRGKKTRLPRFQQPRAGELGGLTPIWIIFMLEVASSELGIRGTARLPNPAANSSEMSIRL
jgi:hypothetical protein